MWKTVRTYHTVTQVDKNGQMVEWGRPSNTSARTVYLALLEPWLHAYLLLFSSIVCTMFQDLVNPSWHYYYICLSDSVS